VKTVRHTFLTSLLTFIFVAVGLTQQPKPARNTTPDASRDGFSTHHPVTTQSVEAQRLFDQGLKLIYALDYSGAANTFRRAHSLIAKPSVSNPSIANSKEHVASNAESVESVMGQNR